MKYIKFKLIVNLAEKVRGISRTSKSWLEIKELKKNNLVLRGALILRYIQEDNF